MFRSISIVGLFLVSLTFVQAQNSQPEPCQSLPTEDQDRTSSEYVDLAIDLDRLGMFSQAVSYLECAIALQPDNALAYYELGYNQFVTEQYALAVEYTSKAIEFDFSPLDWAYHIRARSNQALGFYNEALADYAEAIALGDGSRIIIYYADRGTLYTDLGEYEKALEDYNYIIELAPNDGGLYYLRGRVFDRMADYEKALLDYDQAIAIGRSKSLPIYYTARGGMYTEMGLFEEAMENLSYAIELSPETAIYYFNRGVALEQQGQYQLALADYSTAIRLDEDGKANFYFTRAKLHGRLGNCEEAISDFNRAAQMTEPETDLPFSLEDILSDECSD
jgi:tetratricopeptide (TPR) repeat protein